MHRLPREAWTLARVLGALLTKMGRTACCLAMLWAAGRQVYGPHSQNADSSPRAQGALRLGFKAKPKGKHGAPRNPIACGPAYAW